MQGQGKDQDEEGLTGPPGRDFDALFRELRTCLTVETRYPTCCELVREASVLWDDRC